MGTIADRPLHESAKSGFRPLPGRRRQGLLHRAFLRLLTWQGRVSERAKLAELDARMLKDIGLSPADVEREVGKPFWRS